MQLLQQHAEALAAAAVVVIGLAVIGPGDVLRFSIRRAAAIASVCFRQSIRRRVLWLTPVVIAGVLAVAQFQKALDAQDAVRQSTMHCLFAAGLLTVLLSIILACTNLPAEIENRVICTVATKPVTRLEMVVGKTAGFAAVSFWVLLIMGVFTLAYLHWQDWQLRRAIGRDLETNAVEEASRPTLLYYRDHGTLHARELGMPARLDILARMPAGDDDRWVPGGAEGEIMVRFRIDRALLPPPAEAPRADELGPLPETGQRRWPGGLVLVLDVEARRAGAAPATSPTTAPPTQPSIGVDLRNGRLESVVSSVALGYTQIELPPQRIPLALHIPQEQLDRWVPRTQGVAEVYVAVTTGADGYEYTVRREGTSLQAPERRFNPLDIIYGGRLAWQLRGGPGVQRVAIYQFRGHALPRGTETHSFELRSLLEADYWDSIEEAPIMRVVLDVHNRRTGYTARGIEVFPESNRPAYFTVPAAAIDDGTGRADFDVTVRMSTGGWITLRGGANASLKLIIRDQLFAWNILKSLLILWLLSLLVIVISILCSTFLSWPVAVVLTLVILGGRWAAQQLGDLTEPGIGRQIVDDMFRGSTAATSRAVSESVDALVAALRLISGVLPDIGAFAAIDAPQRGVAISAATLLEAGGVAALFGLPLLVLGYVFLRFKEVAP